MVEREAHPNGRGVNQNVHRDPHAPDGNVVLPEVVVVLVHRAEYHLRGVAGALNAFLEAVEHRKVDEGVCQSGQDVSGIVWARAKVRAADNVQWMKLSKKTCFIKSICPAVFASFCLNVCCVNSRV